MGLLEYVVERTKECSSIEISPHAKERAELRGIDIEDVREALEEGELLGARDNDNPNVELEYEESYLVLVSSPSGDYYYLPVYFWEKTAVITTVLKLSKSNLNLFEW